MQNNNSTFKIELQQVKNIKTVLIDNVYHIYATRIDDRPTCCHNHKMQIKDYRRVFDSCFDIKHNEKLKTALFFCQILKYFLLYGVVLLFKV